MFSGTLITDLGGNLPAQRRVPPVANLHLRRRKFADGFYVMI